MSPRAHHRLWLTLALLGAGCAAAPPRAATLHLRDVAAEDNPWRGSDDVLSRSMRAIAQQLEGAGLKPGQEVFRGFLTAGARATHALELPARSCFTLIAIASPGVHDMDAALYSPDGDLLAVDSQPDAHPTLQVCTGGEPHTLYYALQVYEGAGSFLMAGFLGQQSTLETAAKLLGARAAVARLGHAEPDGPGRVSAFRDGLQRRGFQPLEAPLQVTLAQKQAVRVPLVVQPGQCYTAAGFALDGLGNVDLRVLDEEGSEIARDASKEQDAGVQFCADRSAEFAAELRAVKGAGNALLLMFHVDAAIIGGQSGLWLGERPLANASARPLGEVVAELSQRALQDGYKPGRTLRQGRLTQSEVVEQAFNLGARKCARIDAVGGPGVRRLELLATDGAGRTLARAEGASDTTYVHVCSAAGRELSLQARAEAGAGPYALRVHEASLAALAPAGADDVVTAAMLQALRQARDLGYTPAKAWPRHLELRRDHAVSLELAPEQAHCVRLYLLSSEPSAHGQVLFAGKQRETTVEEGEPARVCAQDAQAHLTGPLELRVTSDAQQADAWLMVMSR